MFYRQAWEEINLDHLDHNLGEINKQLQGKALLRLSKLMLMVLVTIKLL